MVEDVEEELGKSRHDVWTDLYPCLRIEGVTDRSEVGKASRTRLLLRPTT
jgi:hypothetical protein